MIDAKEFGAELAIIVRAATAPLIARIDALERGAVALEERLEEIRPELPDISALIEGSIADAMKTIPLPRDGRDGVDGKDGADGESVLAEDLIPIIEEMVKGEVDGVAQGPAVVDFAARLRSAFSDARS